MSAPSSPLVFTALVLYLEAGYLHRETHLSWQKAWILSQLQLIFYHVSFQTFGDAFQFFLCTQQFLCMYPRMTHVIFLTISLTDANLAIVSA